MSSAPWTPMDHFNYTSDRIYKLKELKEALQKNFKIITLFIPRYGWMNCMKSGKKFKKRSSNWRQNEIRTKNYFKRI